MVVIHLCLLHLFFSCTKHIALTLWDQLGDGTPQHHQKSVELFYQLHNLVPSSSICEDVISQQLTHRDKASCSCIYLKMSKVYAEIYLEKGLGASEEGMNNFNIEKNIALCCFKCYFRFVMSLQFHARERRFFTVQQQTYAGDYLLSKSCDASQYLKHVLSFCCWQELLTGTLLTFFPSPRNLFHIEAINLTFVLRPLQGFKFQVCELFSQLQQYEWQENTCLHTLAIHGCVTSGALTFLPFYQSYQVNRSECEPVCQSVQFTACHIVKIGGDFQFHLDWSVNCCDCGCRTCSFLPAFLRKQ